MKKVIYTLAFVVIGITASYAQKPNRQKLTATERAEKSALAMQQKLGLNDEQKQKITQIELERINKMGEMRTKDELSKEEKKTEMRDFAKANREKIDAILTPEQKKTLQANREEIKDKMKDRGEKEGRQKRGRNN